MEEVVRELRPAFERVAANKGAPGPDGQTITKVRQRLDELLPVIERRLLDDRYVPGKVRRKEIPKADGKGVRELGIPDVIDRMVQEAVRAVLAPTFDRGFHPSSHGFRPGRSCHSAIVEGKGHVEAGFGMVVDLDLSRFFDRVSHQRLLDRLGRRVADRRMLHLIKRMLKAQVVLEDGVVIERVDGVPQGGPLSPLLSNIVLDELDRELSRRGHRFVRYADDVNIYVRSKRAGDRVFASVRRFIERRLRLVVNEEKSAVASPGERHFVGFCLVRDVDGTVKIALSDRSVRRGYDKLKELTPRNYGGPIARCIAGLNRYLKGWFGFFGIVTVSPANRSGMHAIDAHARRRLRALTLKQWKRKRTIARKLIRLGVNKHTAWRQVYEGRKSLWALSHSYVVNRGLNNQYFKDRGLLELANLWQDKHQPTNAPPEQLSFCFAGISLRS